ncbi:MAG: toll/interleukin-1 receptor domain-containing protein [Paraburkholderia tropica]|uniref:toll/interleukin-1 receptor domain-containing protein n=1 Tax=Paraburkholderia tropica TaxID=92647 RepID=UPI0031016BED
MATLRQYYETDFPNYLRIFGILEHHGETFEVDVCHEFTAYAMFAVVYIHGADRSKESIRSIVQSLSKGGELAFSNKAALPAAKTFHGSLRIENKPQSKVDFGATLLTSPRELKTSELHYTTRLFLYCESLLEKSTISDIMDEAEKLNINLQVRTPEYAMIRSNQESPLAFISHDSRDKSEVARPIATTLQGMMCPVWYDEFSMSVGDSLRESIEKGLRECKKCVLVLSKNFLSNTGWGKKEFDSIFTREIIFEQRLVLPIWVDVSKQDVYQYSPSLADTLGLNFTELGVDEVCRRLYNKITVDNELSNDLP